jgi:hypothetical protein
VDARLSTILRNRSLNNGCNLQRVAVQNCVGSTLGRIFDLAGWEWHVNPVCVGDWSPDFWVSFPCSHSECGSHTLLISVLPIDNIEDYNNHPSLKHAFTIEEDPQRIHEGVEAGAAFLSQFEYQGKEAADILVYDLGIPVEE